MEILAMAPVWSQSGSELLASLDSLYAAKSLIDTRILQATGRLHEMGTAQELGARDTVELMSERYRLNPTEVRKDLAFSAALPKYRLVTDALPDPTDPTRPAILNPDHAKAIVTTLEKAPSSVAVDVLDVAEEQMINAARLNHPRKLLDFGREVLARLDTDGAEPAEDEALAKESLRLRSVEGGVKFSGFLAGAKAEQFTTQMHALSKPHKTIDGERDPRTLEQRQADALKMTLDAAAGNPDYPGVPHLTVTIDFEDLKNDVANAPEALRANDATGGSGGELVFGGNLSASAVRLLACDAAILPIVLGGDSQPLDVGTEQRFVNRYIRRALNKRDKGCVVCTAPPWMCHAHHIIHWANGGPTSLQNLVLLCAAHHRAVHNGQWAISITGGIVHVTRPGWADPPAPDPTALTALLTWATPTTTNTNADADADADRPTPPSNADPRGLAPPDYADIWGPAPAHNTDAGGLTPPRDAPAGGFTPPEYADIWGPAPAHNTGAGGANAGAGRAGVSSNPAHEQPDRLPAGSTLPNPGLASTREALQTRPTSLTPNHFDPWATNATPADGP